MNMKLMVDKDPVLEDNARNNPFFQEYIFQWGVDGDVSEQSNEDSSSCYGDRYAVDGLFEWSRDFDEPSGHFTMESSSEELPPGLEYPVITDNVTIRRKSPPRLQVDKEVDPVEVGN